MDRSCGMDATSKSRSQCLELTDSATVDCDLLATRAFLWSIAHLRW